MAETVLPRYKVDASGDLVPDVRAAAAIVFNPKRIRFSGRELAGSALDREHPKVMTATVFLESNPDLSQPVAMARSDVFPGVDDASRAYDK